MLVGFTETLAMGGAAMTTVLLSEAVDYWGWRSAIFTCGIIGVTISLLIALIVRNKPGDSRWLPVRVKVFSLKAEVQNSKTVIRCPKV